MLAKFSVKKPYTVLVTVVLVIILGVVSFTEMTPDLLPSIELPYAVVATSYVGASPEEVEMTVTKPIEQTLATLNNIKNISSTSNENMSMVILEFEDDANMDAMGVDIREKLDMISGYWEDSVGSPIIMKLNPDMMPVQVAAVDIDEMDNIELSTYVKEEVIPLLESTEGVASVTATGLIDNQIKVVINKKKIDKINKKIEDSVIEKMDEAETKLNEAKQEITSGQESLSKKQEELSKGMTEASQAISSARLELLKNEISMSDSKSELEAKKIELENAEDELSFKENEYAENEGKITTQLEEAYSALEQINKALAVATDEEKEALLLKEQELKAGIEQLEQAKQTLTSAKPELEAARDQLEEGKKALQVANEQLEAGSAKIEEGKTQLNQKEQELEAKKDSAQAQIKEGENQLSNGESEINSQIETFDTTKENALKQANIEDKITTDMVSSILQAQNFSMPAGYVQEDGVDYLVRVGDKLETLDEIKKLVLFDAKLETVDPITLIDVADVFYSDNSKETYAKMNGNAGVILTFQKQTSYATATVSDNISEKFKEIQNEKEGLHFTTLMDQGVYIDLVIRSVMKNLIMGGMLAIIILFLFLRDIRPTAIIACSIPLSVIFAIVLMYFSGVTLNIISLSGLAVGVGMLVDNSVVVIENIYRLRSKGVPAHTAAVTGAKQVSGAIVSSTLTTISVFLPIVFVKGISRQLFTDMALTIGYSLVASLIVALSLVPAMSSGLLKNTKERTHSYFDFVLKGYEKVLKRVLKVKPLVLILAVLILVGSIYGAFQNGTAFMSDMDSMQISVSMEMPEGSTLNDTIEMSDEIVKRVQEMEDVDTVGAMLASKNTTSFGLNMEGSKTDAVSMYVILNEDKKKSSQAIANEITNRCEDLDCELQVSASNMDMSALGGSGISVQIKGPELDTLKELANQVAIKLSKVEGTKNVFNGIFDPTKEIRIVVNKKKAMLKGLTVAQVYMDIKEAIEGDTKATTLSTHGEEYEIIVTEKAKEEMSREDIKNYVFTTTDIDGKNKKVKLEDIAKVEEDYSLSTISREAQERYLSVTAELKDGYNIGTVNKEVEAVVDTVKMPSGYKIVYSGENQTINEALGQMVKMLLLAVSFIYLIMVAQFQSLLSPFIVMFTIPLAFTGGFLGLMVTKNEVSVIAVLGFIMLAGIVVNNGIVLVDYINQLRSSGMDKKKAIVEAGKTRMRPILMTALTTILGLSTLAIGIGMGSEMMQPIAIVTIGGLLYATIMTLFILPILYDLFHRKDRIVISEEDLVYVEEETNFSDK